MPIRYREQFPVRTLDVHVYDPDPAKRWVMIDGKRYREGDTLASGPQIAQIIESGVVFDYQGAQDLLPVRRFSRYFRGAALCRQCPDTSRLPHAGLGRAPGRGRLR